jgi:polyisoprenoid-binding protein YceI
MDTTTSVKLPAIGTYSLNPSMTTVGFVTRKLMVSKIRGAFEKFDGTLVVADPPEKSQLEVRVETASIQTREEKRDAHLRSPDFLDVENFPLMTFKSTSVERVDDTTLKVSGDLTIKDVTRPVTLDVEYEGLHPTPWGFEQMIFSATGEINREEWGLTWNQVLEAGNVLVGPIVKLDLEAAFKPS